MQEDNSKKSFKNRIKPYLPTVAMCSVTGIVTGLAVYFRPTVTWCHITMEDVDYLKEQGHGVIEFGMDTRNKTLVALPYKW